MSTVPQKQIRDLMGQWFLSNFIMLLITPVTCLIPYFALVACPVMFLIVMPTTNFVFFWKYMELAGQSKKIQEQQNKLFNPESYLPKEGEFYMFGPFIDPWIKPWVEPWLKNDLWTDYSNNMNKMMDLKNMNKMMDPNNMFKMNQMTDGVMKSKEDVEYNKMKKIINQNTQKIKDLEDLGDLDLDDLDDEEVIDKVDKVLESKKTDEDTDKSESCEKNPNQSSCKENRSRVGMIIGIIMFIILLGGIIAAIVIMQKKNIINPRELLNY